MMTTNSVIPSNKSGILILIFIVLVAVGLRVYSAAGFIPKDDAEFSKVAYQMSQGTFDYEAYEGPPVIPVRTGIILPTAASLAVFGTGEIQLAIYPLLSSIVILFLIYMFSARLFGHSAARIAAAIWAFLPMEIEIATTLWPEVPATAFAFIGIYLLFVARTGGNDESRKQLTIGLAAGFAFGLSWLCKASVVYFVPFCIILLFFDFSQSRFKRLPLWSGVAAGSVLVLTIEMIVYGAVNDDFFYRFTAIQRNYQLYPEFFFTEGGRFGFDVGIPFWKAVVKRVVMDGPAFIFLNGHFLYLPLFGLLALLHGLYRKDQRFYLMGILLLSLVVMFNGFSASLHDYQPLPLFNRYFYPICVPAVILTAGMLSNLMASLWARNRTGERPEKLFWGGIVAVVLVSTIAWSTFREVRDSTGKWSAAEKYLATVLSPGDHITTDVMSRNGLEFFWDYPADLNVFLYGEPGQQLRVACDSYVLKNQSYNEWLATNYGSWLAIRGFELPENVANPPNNWIVEWTNNNATLYKVSCPHVEP